MTKLQLRIGLMHWVSYGFTSNSLEFLETYRPFMTPGDMAFILTSSPGELPCEIKFIPGTVALVTVGGVTKTVHDWTPGRVRQYHDIEALSLGEDNLSWSRDFCEPVDPDDSRLFNCDFAVFNRSLVGSLFTNSLEQATKWFVAESCIMETPPIFLVSKTKNY
jgi:hypothetical protein